MVVWSLDVVLVRQQGAGGHREGKKLPVVLGAGTPKAVLHERGPRGRLSDHLALSPAS
jgi:hypothetical protein